LSEVEANLEDAVKGFRALLEKTGYAGEIACVCARAVGRWESCESASNIWQGGWRGSCAWSPERLEDGHRGLWTRGFEDERENGSI